jgi:hypothetical protein
VHDLCDELGLRCQVDITAGAARARTNVDDRPVGFGGLEWADRRRLVLGGRSQSPDQTTNNVFVVVGDPHASNQSMPSLTRSNFNA